MKILIRVLLFQKLISLHNNMFPGCVFRALFYIFFSLLSSEQMNWSILKGRLGPLKGESCRVDGWGHFPELRQTGGQTMCKLLALLWLSEEENPHGFMCRVILGIFPVDKPSHSVQTPWSLPWPSKDTVPTYHLFDLLYYYLFNMFGYSPWQASHFPISMPSLNKNEIENHHRHSSRHDSSNFLCLRISESCEFIDSLLNEMHIYLNFS